MPSENTSASSSSVSSPYLSYFHFRTSKKAWEISCYCFPGGSDDKESACQCRRHEFDLWMGKIPWRRKWKPTPVFLPGESHERRSLEGYSPWGHKESDMTEWISACAHTHTHTHTHTPVKTFPGPGRMVKTALPVQSGSGFNPSLGN